MPPFVSLLALAASGLLSQEITASAPGGDLKGLWTRTANPSSPVLLMIPGSGPTDRDGNSPRGIQAGTYRLLAEALGEKGVSTVRIDKRGMFSSAAAASDPNAVTIDDYADDLRLWVKTVRAATGAACVWLLGHSEGGLVALAAAQGAADVCGLILVATPGRPLGEVLRAQLHANPANAPFLAQADAAIEALTRGERVDEATLPTELVPLFAPAIQGFLVSAFSLDPAKLLAGVSKPVLILQGDSDIQVGVADAEALKAAAPSATLVRLPGINHVLKSVPPDDPAANVATYADPDLPLAPGVAEAIIEFLKAHEKPD